MKEPVWDIMQDGTAEQVDWVEHETNKRFAIYHPPNTESPSGDLVLDRETGLVWCRDAGLTGQSDWWDAVTSARELALGNRRGWRLPSVEELSSLIDSTRAAPTLPEGHPFVNVDTANFYWTYTKADKAGTSDSHAWFVTFQQSGGQVATIEKDITAGRAWPVRGGSGASR